MFLEKTIVLCFYFACGFQYCELLIYINGDVKKTVLLVFMNIEGFSTRTTTNTPKDGCQTQVVDLCLMADTGSMDTMTIYNALRTMLAPENSTHAASRSPILCASHIDMAQRLLSLAYQCDENREILHVLPGAHNLMFRIRFRDSDSTHSSYTLSRRWQDNTLHLLKHEKADETEKCTGPKRAFCTISAEDTVTDMRHEKRRALV